MHERLWGNQREVTVFALALWHVRCTFSCSALTVCTRPRASRFAAISEGIMLQQQGQQTSAGHSAALDYSNSALFSPRRILWAINITETFPKDRRGTHVCARLPLIRNGSACPGCSGASSSSSPSYSSSVELLPFLPSPSTSVVSWRSLKRVCQMPKNVIGCSTPEEQQGFLNSSSDLVGITSPALRFWAGGNLFQAESSPPAVLRPWVLQNERVGVSVPSSPLLLQPLVDCWQSAA